MLLGHLGERSGDSSLPVNQGTVAVKREDGVGDHGTEQ